MGIVICSDPKCQTAAGCVCNMVPWKPTLPSASPSEGIVGAAYDLRGVILSLPAPARHGDIICKYFYVHPAIALDPQDSGFITSAGRFVDRQEAWRIAEANRQILLYGPCRGTLYSEDVW